jgi:hypothetical protein
MQMPFLLIIYSFYQTISWSPKSLIITMIDFCRDSWLTVTGNIISVLTFVLGLLAPYLAFCTLTRHALSEIETFKQDLDLTQRQLHSVLDCYFSDSCMAPAAKQDPDGAFHRLILALMATLDSLLLELEGLKSEHLRNVNGWWGHKQIRSRLRWINKRKEISGRMARISRQKMEVEVSQISLLLRCENTMMENANTLLIEFTEKLSLKSIKLMFRPKRTQDRATR